MKLVIITADPKTLLCHRREMLEAMAAQGCQITAVAGGHHEEAEAFLAQIGGNYRQLPLARASLNPLKDLKTLFTLRRILREEQPHAVFAYTIKSVCYGALAAKMAGISEFYPLICGLGYSFAEHGNLKQKVVSRVSRFLYGLALPRSKHVFFQNHDDQRLMQDLGLLPLTVPSTVVPGSGVDTERFSAHLLDQLELDPARIRFLFISRMLRSKGAEDFVEAARLLRHRNPAWEFHMVGATDPSPDGLSLEQMRHWHEEGLIRYHGESHDVQAHLRHSHVVVLPSYYREGVPRILLEALSTGRPIITTNSVGCRETIAHSTRSAVAQRGGEEIIQGLNGFLVAPQNAKVLAKAMHEAARDPAKLAEMSRASRSLAESRFPVSEVIRLILQGMNIPRSADAATPANPPAQAALAPV